MPDVQKPRSSYLKLLEASVREDPNIWKSWSFYAGELIHAGRFDEAHSAYQKAMTLPGADVSFLMMQVAWLYERQGNLIKASNLMDEAAFKSEGSRELAMYAAELHSKRKNKAQALQLVEVARGRVNRSSGYSFDPSCWDDGFERRLKSILDEI